MAPTGVTAAQNGKESLRGDVFGRGQWLRGEAAVTDQAPLEQQVRLLAAALELQVDDPADVISGEVVALARAGQQPEAVRLLRKTTGLGLIEAKRVVDAARVA
jgi:ribosomal protein L7/L12